MGREGEGPCAVSWLLETIYTELWRGRTHPYTELAKNIS